VTAELLRLHALCKTTWEDSSHNNNNNNNSMPCVGKCPGWGWGLERALYRRYANCWVVAVDVDPGMGGHPARVTLPGRGIRPCCGTAWKTAPCLSAGLNLYAGVH